MPPHLSNLSPIPPGEVPGVEPAAGRAEPSNADLLGSNPGLLLAALDRAVMVAVTDERGGLLEVNDRFCELRGCSRAQALSGLRSVFDRCQPASAAEDPWQTVADGRLWRGEVCGRAHDGSWYCADTTILPLVAGVGQARAVVVQTDITRRKRAERRLAAEHALAGILSVARDLGEAAPAILRALCQHLDWGCAELLLVDPAGSRLQPVAGWPPVETPGPPATFASGEGLPGAVWATGRPQWRPEDAAHIVARTCNCTAGGGVRAALGFPIRQGQRVVGVIDVFTAEPRGPDDDLLLAVDTIGIQIGEFLERVRAEAALRASEENYRAIFDVGGDAVLVHDPASGRILDVNRRATELFGYPREVLLARSIAELSADGSAATQAEALRYVSAAAAGKPQLIERRARQASGQSVWVEVSLREATIGGEPRIVAVVRDISERKRLEAARRALEEELGAQSRQVEGLKEQLRDAEKLAALGVLASQIAHEVGTPLNVMLGRLELLAGHPQTPEVLRRDLDVVGRQIERIAKIIRDMLELTRMRGIRFEPVDLARLLGGLRELLRTRLEAAEVTLELEVAAGAATIHGDEGRFQQLFLNLLMNSLEAMAGPGRIAVRCVAAADGGQPGVRVEVSDTGRGIVASDLARVFEPFFSTKKNQGGTGLGLPIVQNIVRGHGGRLMVESEPGLGTTIRVWLPANPPS